MKELNLHEEIIKSLQLMSYDRSLSLNEQSNKYTWSDNKDKKNNSSFKPNTETTYSVTSQDKERKQTLQKQKNKEDITKEFLKGSEKSCNTLLNRTPKYQYQKTAKEVFLELRDEVGVQKEFKLTSPSTWLEPSSWGTSDTDLLTALKKIKDKQTYNEVIKYIWSCYPKHGVLGKQSNIIQFLQDEEYSKGQFLSKSFSNSEMTPMLSYQYYFNDKTLDQFENILRKFNPDEIYSKEYNLVSNKWSDQAKGIVLPPLVRETLHVVLPILSAIAVVATGGAASFMGKWALYGIIELADAMIYVMDNDNFMAGLSLFFALIPAGRLFKLLPSMRKLIAKGGKNSVYVFLDKLIGKTSEPLNQVEKSLIKELSTSAVRGEMAAQLIRVTTANIMKKSIGGRVAYHFIRGIIFLVKYGYLGIEFLTNMGLFIAGGFWSWSKIASSIGLGEEVNQIVKNKTIKPREESEDDSTKDMYNIFNEYYSQNLSLSNVMSSTFKIEVFYLQVFLERSGNNYITPFWNKQTSITDDKDIVTYTMGGIKQKEGNKVFVFINERPNKKSAIDLKGQEIEIVGTPFDGKYKIIDLNYKDNKVVGVYINTKFKPKNGVDLTYKNKGKIKIKSAIKGIIQGVNPLKQQLSKIKTEGGKLTFKDGYFGQNTLESVKTYQQKNNIKPTGVVDQETMKKILSDLKSKKYGKMNIPKNKLLKNMDKQLMLNQQQLPKNIEEPQIDTLIVNKSQQFTDSITNSLINSFTITDSTAAKYENYSLK